MKHIQFKATGALEEAILDRTPLLQSCHLVAKRDLARYYELIEKVAVPKGLVSRFRALGMGGINTVGELCMLAVMHGATQADLEKLRKMAPWELAKLLDELTLPEESGNYAGLRERRTQTC